MSSKISLGWYDDDFNMSLRWFMLIFDRPKMMLQMILWWLYDDFNMILWWFRMVSKFVQDDIREMLIDSMTSLWWFYGEFNEMNLMTYLWCDGDVTMIFSARWIRTSLFELNCIISYFIVISVCHKLISNLVDGEQR